MTLRNNYSVHIAKSVQEFLDYLLPSAAHWKAAKRGDLGYRGQASSVWLLVPKTFRDGQGASDEPDGPANHPRRVVPQARVEFRAVHEFVKAADASGLRIGETGGRLLLGEEPRRIFDDSDWEYNWPQEQVLETLALAQHHGVPTRLLDCTEDPWVGAYFAASSAWEELKNPLQEDPNYLAVWVIDLRFVRAVSGIVRRYPERIGEIRVPRANNPYLRAQFGFFLIDRGANDVMTRGELPSIDTAIAERARFWHRGKRLSSEKIEQMWFDELPVRQVRLRTTLAGELLKELGNRGVTRGSLMPSLDRVVESLEFERGIC